MRSLSGIRWAADTLSGRLALVFALLVLPPTMVSVYLAWDSYVEHTARAKLQVRQFATLTATYESKFFDDARRILQQLGNEETIRQGGGADCDGMLDRVLERTPEFADIGYFDSGGQKVCGRDDNLPDISNYQWLREIRRFRGFAISDYTVTPNSTYPVIVAAQAVYGPEGYFQGVLAASIRLYWLSAFIREISLPVESVFFLVDSNGNILADRAAMLAAVGQTAPVNGFGETGFGSLSAVIGSDFASAILSRSVTDFESDGPDGVHRVFSAVALPHGNVTVLFGMPAVSAFGGLEKDLINRVLSLAAIWFAGLGAAWLGTRYLVTRWTSALRGMARAYGKGDYAPKPNFTNAPRELRDLGETLALMAHRVEVREAELRTSLHQKDLVLREIHHRVKNNLQIVSSLLNLRVGGIADAPEQMALKEVKAHVRAMALVHRHLYESDDIQRVDLGSFMTELCQGTLAGLSAPSRRVSVEIDIPEFMISTDRAVPIALLVTEAMTNALKHAFPDGRRGRIQVAFARDGAHSGTLTVADDGIGIPAKARETSGIGLKLIEAFARQIGGELTYSGPPGTVVRVTFDDGATVSDSVMPDGGAGDDRAAAAPLPAASGDAAA
jgi:two-component sensor histidine kinase